MDSVGISPRPSLTRKYGSTTDINGNVDNYSNDITPKRTHVTTTRLNGNNNDIRDTRELPDINDRPNSASSRSPSVDRVRKNNTLNNNYTSGQSTSMVGIS